MFFVAAGEFYGNGRTCSYCDSFESLDEAIVAYFSHNDYPWCDLEYHSIDDTTFIINPYAKIGE